MPKRKNPKRYYVYIYYDPRKNNIEFYVGESGDPKRWLKHLKDAKRFIEQKKSQKWIKENCDNPHKTRTIIKILEAGLEPKIEKVLENVTEEQAKAEEIRLITLHGRADKGLGPLTNLTDGGDGGDTISNHPNRKEILKKKSESMKGKKNALGYKFTPEQIKSLSKRMRGEGNPFFGKTHSTETRTLLTTHGMTKTPEYSVWLKMREHCYSSNSKAYKFYGAKGITVCNRWLNSFENFYEDMGDRPSDIHVLKISKGEKIYSKETCSWRLFEELYEFDEVTKSLKEWSEEKNISLDTLYGRLRKGWSIKETLTEITSNNGRNNPNSKSVIFIDGNGNKHFVNGEFINFCKDHDLNIHPMRAILWDKRKNKFHRGWTVTYGKEK